MAMFKFGRTFTRAYSSLAPDPSYEASAKLWQNISLFVGMPTIVLSMINAYLRYQEEHHEPRPEFAPYEHLRVRNKRFPWGDGNHTLFHNPHTNPLPTGYED